MRCGLPGRVPMVRVTEGRFEIAPGLGPPSRFGDGVVRGPPGGPRTRIPVTGAAVRWGAGTASVVVTAGRYMPDTNTDPVKRVVVPGC